MTTRVTVQVNGEAYGFTVDKCRIDEDGTMRLFAHGLTVAIFPEPESVTCDPRYLFDMRSWDVLPDAPRPGS